VVLAHASDDAANALRDHADDLLAVRVGRVLGRLEDLVDRAGGVQQRGDETLELGSVDRLHDDEVHVDVRAQRQLSRPPADTVLTFVPIRPSSQEVGEGLAALS
jgi:hypothetical protein